MFVCILILHCLCFVCRVDKGSSRLPENGKLKQVPVPVLNDGLHSVIEYLRNIQVYEPRQRVKMLFVGYAEAGKTTLLNLMHKLNLNITVRGTFWNLWKDIAYEAEICGPELVLKFNGSRTNYQLNNNWTLLPIKTEHSLILIPPNAPTIEIIIDDKSDMQKFSQRIRHLVHSRADDPDLATHGIDVRSFQLTGKDPHSKPVDIMAWDFAGQKEYYSMHDRFVGDQSLYVVVWDVRKERDENAGGALLDWFRMLRVNLPSYNDREALYKNTAIIVIGTHIDLLPPDQRLEDACKKRDRYVKRIASKAGLDWFLELKKFVQPSHMMIQKLPNCSCYCVARQPNLLVKAELSQKSFWTWREKLTVRGAHKKYGMKIIGLSNRLPNWM